MKVEYPDGYGKYNEYDFDNRITYDESSDSMYIYVAPPQGQVGTVMVYSDKQRNMISIDGASQTNGCIKPDNKVPISI